MILLFGFTLWSALDRDIESSEQMERYEAEIVYILLHFFSIKIWENAKCYNNNFDNIYIDIPNHVTMWVLENHQHSSIVKKHLTVDVQCRCTRTEI